VEVPAGGATTLLAVFVELSEWATWLNLTVAMVVVTNQFERTDASTQFAMGALIVGEVGGFAVLLAGFVAGQFV
jgi:hypothetical protein